MDHALFAGGRYLEHGPVAAGTAEIAGAVQLAAERHEISFRSARVGAILKAIERLIRGSM